MSKPPKETIAANLPACKNEIGYLYKVINETCMYYQNK